ncbi:MAG: hypothetical protein ACODAU_04290 [Myxococcota bacterium]
MTLTRATPIVLLTAALSASCSTLGADRPPQPPPPSSGAGPFRPLRASELGNESGLVLEAQESSVESGMMAGNHLYYAAGDPPRIHRAGPGELPPFEPGPMILQPMEAWEGAAVFDPWAVVLEDGTTRLYYAGDDGVGMAEATEPGGDFTRVGPVLQADPAVEGGATPRRPSVVARDGGGWLMYYQVGDVIAVAQSDDGRAFEHELVLELGLPEEANGPPEVAVATPAAVVATTPVGRRVTRLYFTSIRDDDTTVLGFAASLDGFVFERSAVPPVQADNPAFPAPVLLEEPATLLLHTADAAEDRQLVGAIAPADAELER